MTAAIIARGKVSSIRAARRRSVVVGRARVRKVSTGARVQLRFTPAARRELGRVRFSRLTIRTTIRHSNGRVVVADRPLILR